MVEIDELKLEELNDKNGVSLNFYANFDWRIDPTTIPDWLTDRTSSLLPLKIYAEKPDNYLYIIKWQQ